MLNVFKKKISKSTQYLISVLLICLVSVISFFALDLTGYRVVALVLLLALSVLAMAFDIAPVMIAAFLSALVWDYFFIPPRFNFHIRSTEDVLLLLMYFFVALINAILFFKIRQIQKKVRHREEKENTIRLYNTVLNSLSHELRTPIATILGAADGLLQKDNKLSEENKRELTCEISTASLRLNAQVENLLNMSRLEAGFIQPKPDWCDLTELIYSVTNKLEPELISHRLIIEIQESLPLFRLDFGMMDQIIQNLVKNAIQHTQPGSSIVIDAAYAREQCLVTISDSGKGFPANETERVFDKFYRLQNSSTGGIGLGLSIVKGFVLALEGTVQAGKSRLGGAEFRIAIPAEASFVNNIKDE